MDECGRSEIQNRDIPLLSDVLSIMQEITRLEQLQSWERDRMVHITQVLTGMPRGGQARGLDDAVAVLDEITREHQERCKDYARQLRRAQRIINEIESRSMRTFVLMRYVMQISDAEIRRELNMSRRGFERAKKCVETAPSMAAVKWQERYIVRGEDAP